MRKMKQLISKGLLLLFVIASILGNRIVSKAEDFGSVTSVVFGETIDIYNATVGETISISVPVKSVNNTINRPLFTPTCEEKGINIVSKVSLSRENYAEPPTFITAYENTYVNFDIKIADTVQAGIYDIKLKVNYYDSLNNPATAIEMVEPIRINVAAKPIKTAPSITITNLSHDGGDQLVKGDSFNIGASIKNTGELPAKKVQVSIEGYDAAGILQNYTTEKKELGTLEGSGTKQVTFPVYASKTVTSGVKTLTMKVTYLNAAGETQTESSNIYITIPAVKEAPPQVNGTANLLIKDVKQSPSSPTAGGKLSISYVIENKGTVDAKEVKIEPTLTNVTFSPIGSEPYKYIAVIKAGESKKIKVNYTVSKQAVEGLNEILLTITYKEQNKIANKDNDSDNEGDGSGDGNGDSGNAPGETVTETKTTTSKLYVLDVKNPAKKEEVKGVPKLIIKDFSTGEDNIKASKEFDFAFDINNTHSNLSANNIKVTLTSEENAFSVAKGSNSFYISTIKPGDTSHQVVQLKAKADCVTKSYPLKIEFEYEYEGMQKLENEISTGLKIYEVLSLQVFENSRPTVSNIIMGTWDALVAFAPGNMSFDFRNLGKSTLYNVTAKLESTDYKSTLQNIFIGNVEAGNGNTYEMEVTPQVENVEAKGVLVITYEDSNGNSYDVNTDLPVTFISPPQSFDPGINPEGDPSLDIKPDEKKEILPMWAFIIVQVVAFFLGIIIFRKIIIGVYKIKLRKKEEKEG